MNKFLSIAFMIWGCFTLIYGAYYVPSYLRNYWKYKEFLKAHTKDGTSMWSLDVEWRSDLATVASCLTCSFFILILILCNSTLFDSREPQIRGVGNPPIRYTREAAEMYDLVYQYYLEDINRQ